MKKLALYFLIGAAALGGLATLLLTRPPNPPITKLPEKDSAGLGEAATPPQDSKTQDQAVVTSTANTPEKLPSFAEEVKRILSGEDSLASEQALTNLLGTMVVRDVREAANQTRTIESPVVREDVTRRVIQAWASQDPAAALAWAEQLSDVSEREAALAQVCIQVAESDPQKAVQLITANHLERDSPGLLDTLATRWASADFTAAADWAKNWAAGEQRDGLIAQVAYAHAQTSPADAARLVVEQIPPGPAQIEAVVSVLHQWGLQDWNGASEWAASFSESPIRERALNELAEIASHRNAHAAPSARP